MTSIKRKAEGNVANPTVWLVLFSVLVGSIFFFAPIIVDDKVNLQWVGTTIRDAWDWSVISYQRWSSRIFIYFIGSIVLQKGSFALGLYMIVSMFVFVKAMVLLFPNLTRKELLPFLFACVLFFPYSTQYTAGWIATLTSYFGPHAFAIMALVPIKKAVDKNKVGILEFLFYAVCLIYGANAEQMCVVLVVVYGICTIYLAVKKEWSFIILLLFLIAIASLVSILVCPGNGNRTMAEEANNFPTYGMLHMIDKADIGISTTLKWFFNNNRLIVLFCSVLIVLVWTKYDHVMYRMIALIPMLATLSFGPLKNIAKHMFSNFMTLTQDVDYYGAFNAASMGAGAGPIQFAFNLFLMLCICLTVIMLNDTVKGLIVDLTLLIMGFVSRIIMGYSPTIYVSSTRTYTSLMVCVMVVLLHLLVTNQYRITKNDTMLRKENIMQLGCILSVFGYIDLLLMVVTVRIG